MDEQNLLEAVQKGTIGTAAFKHLITGGNLNHRDNRAGGHDDSLLICALEAGEMEIARYLIETGANIHETNAHNETALMYAVKELSYRNARCGRAGKFREENCLELVKLLLVSGADINAVSDFDMNVWNYAGRDRTAFQLLRKFSQGKVPKIFAKGYLQQLRAQKDIIAEEKINTVLAEAQEIKSPTITFLAGVPGAGKSQWKKQLVKNSPNNLVVIDPDEFLEKFKNYGYDGKNAGAYSHLAEQIANQVLTYLVVNHRFNIVKDGTFAGQKTEFRNVNRAHRRDYLIIIDYVARALPYCFLNTLEREGRMGRHVPCRVILDKYRKCVFTADAIKRAAGKAVTLNVYDAEANLFLTNFPDLAQYINDAIYCYSYSNKRLIANLKYDLGFSTSGGGLAERLQEKYSPEIIAQGKFLLDKWCPGDRFCQIRRGNLKV